TQPAAVKAETVSGGRYGPVTVTRPSGPLRGFVGRVSREGGWRAADQQAADALAKAGAMTVGVDSTRYAANLAAKQETCHHLDG
ncbi:AcvB/VirJ family lysyl-phosphatidylglycerol hydrolase, partial [Acinetobacter baumannii]